MIAIAVAAAILLYVFSIGLLGTLGASGGQQIRQQLVLEAYDWTGCCPGNVRLWVRNVGAALMIIGDVFVNGQLVDFNTGACHGIIDIQQSCRIHIVSLGTITINAGVAYIVKIVTVDGAMFAYSLTAGKAA